MTTPHPLLDGLRHSTEAKRTAEALQIVHITPKRLATLIDRCGYERFGVLAEHDDNIRANPMPALLRHNLAVRDEWRATALESLIALPDATQRDLVAAIANGTGAHYASLLQQAGNQRLDSILTGMRAANANAEKVIAA